MNPIGKPEGFYYFCDMHRKRLFLSSLLMLAYFVGFAHDDIPHVHESQLAKRTSQDVSPICKTECQAPISIQHADHYDHGLMHLLACLLSNVEHPDGDCNQEICSQVQQKDSRQYRSYASMAAVPLAFFTPMEERSYSVNRFAYCTFRLSSSYFSSLFDRGPPALIL
jgi:hypothetical protein